MTAFGYSLSSEEFPPGALASLASRAEDAGFDFLTISDHYHPWTTTQGHAPFVWTTLGAIAMTTSRIRVGTGVTCPLQRLHPAVVAQAAATTAHLFEGRFFLGLGTGEALNEHVVAKRWPRIEQRRAMLDEAIQILRALFTGDTVDFDGTYYQVDNARLFTHPPSPVPMVVAASGKQAAKLAAESHCGLWSTRPDPDVVLAYRDAGGTGPVYGQVTACVAPSRDEAIQIALRHWPNAGIGGQLSQDLPTWTHFEQASELVTPERLAERVTCGPDPEHLLEKINRYVDAGFDHVHVHQIGPDQEAFFELWEQALHRELQRKSMGSTPRASAVGVPG